MKRIEVLKTYKIYIGGKFPRTESGRFYEATNASGRSIANMCKSSRKDIRNAVVAARKAQGAWQERTAFNRGQILYRIAEILEGRKSQFIEELMLQDSTKKAAQIEVNDCIDRIVYYAGWCDKFNQVASSVNPVSSSHFNFSSYEPTGLVGIISPESSSLFGLVSMLLPVISGGNSCVLIASESKPLCAVTLAEVLNTSDVPPGVVNILTGQVSELWSPLSSHMDVNAISICSRSAYIKDIQIASADNLKRVRTYDDEWDVQGGQGIQYITDFQELKTTWHPIENIGGSSSSY
ncbi:MAG: aldehyde dehydrogenase family protein [Crocinitomicaceae bacterium]|jgi:acyl-CoA reductase-like NAD-dependent aldehyde dehydrogenase|tara:strand:- start:17133 stop:18011 length:879 start_codon:yes stop_codon:yes gene_type:complete